MARKAARLAVALLLLASPARAAFHLALIDEIMSGVGGDPSAQYIQVRMTFPGQSFVADSQLTAFSCNGSVVTPLLLLPTPTWNFFAGGMRTWIMATQNPIGGIVPDFTFSPGIPTPCGMVCWGAPCGLLPPVPGWDVTMPNNYIDCIAYGGYTGPTKTVSAPPCNPTQGLTGTPSSLPPGNGTLALTRITDGSSNAIDFALASPMPTNYVNQVGILNERLTGKKLSLMVGTVPHLTAQSKDTSVTLGSGNGSAHDPVANPSGGSVRVKASGGDGFDTTYNLPTGRWEYMGDAGDNKGYKYKDKDFVDGPISTVLVKPGKMLKVVGKGTGLLHSLASQPASVRVALTLGSLPYCLEFGGTTTFMANKKLIAKDAGASVTCP